MSKVAIIPKLKNGDDEQAAAQLKTLVAEAQNGLRRVVALGLFCFEIKSKLKHGQFQPWLKAHCPETSLRSLKAYMQLTGGVLQKCKISVKSILAKGQSLPISHSGEILSLPDAKVPDEAKPMRDKICTLIDGKSQSQLFFEFKQAEDDDDEAQPLKSKRGRLKGQGGATKAQREAAAEREERERLESIQIKADETTDFLMEYSDVKGFAKLDEIPGGEKTLKKLADAVAYANTFFTSLRTATPKTTK